jgi:tripartite ATP-independent transporter DctP family solute receptor
MLTVLLICVFAGASWAAKKEIHYGTWASDGEAAYEGMKEFKKVVEDATDIEVFLYPSNQLGNTEEQLEQVQMGTIQMMSSGQPPLNEIEYLSLPYLIKSQKNWNAILESPIGQEWNKRCIEERSSRMLGLLARGPRVISANKVINSIEDLKGLKIRSPERDYYVQTLQAFGSQPTPMAYGEIYTSLQTGVVDGQENPVETIYSAGFYEVQKCIVMTNHIDKPAFVVINEDFYQGLSEDERKAVNRAQSAAEKTAGELMLKQQDEFLKKMEAAGVVITYPDLAPFVAATENVRKSLGIKSWGEKNYELIQELGNK